MTALDYAPATDFVEAIRTRRLSPVEVLEDVLERAERLQPSLHPFMTIDADRARDAARSAEAAVMRGDSLGPLHGLPVSVKDLEPTAGLRTTYGSKFFEDFVPDFDGAVAARLRSAGAILFAKSNTPHFGYKDLCDNLLGPPRELLVRLQPHRKPRSAIQRRRAGSPWPQSRFESERRLIPPFAPPASTLKNGMK